MPDAWLSGELEGGHGSDSADDSLQNRNYLASIPRDRPGYSLEKVPLINWGS